MSDCDPYSNDFLSIWMFLGQCASSLLNAGLGIQHRWAVRFGKASTGDTFFDSSRFGRSSHQLVISFIYMILLFKVSLYEGVDCSQAGNKSQVNVVWSTELLKVGSFHRWCKPLISSAVLRIIGDIVTQSSSIVLQMKFNIPADLVICPCGIFMKTYCLEHRHRARYTVL